MHLKNKTKQPAWRTKMDTRNMEYQTAVRDYKQIVLEYGYNKIMRSQKEIGNDNDIDQAKKLVSRLGRTFKVFWSDGDIRLKEISHKKKMLVI